KYLPLRSNVPELATHAFEGLDPEYASRAAATSPSVIVGGQNYGQGSSREHAAMCPLHLGVRAVFAVSFARIHQNNLVNFGILPLTIDAATYDSLEPEEQLRIDGIMQGIEDRLVQVTRTGGESFEASLDITARQARILLAGGLLNYAGQQGR
ncbi:MAG TPA: aconitate hydratase, partial [Armatimonadetes bacterium]|nr:aconitate hydratase [Armatimonadota bacterium]